jgi:hypothetical protein
VILSKTGQMKPSELLEVKVGPLYANYLEEIENERLAGIVVHALDSHLEETFRYYERVDRARLIASANLDVFRKLLYGRCPALRMVRDLVEGKQRLLSRPRSGGGDNELFVLGYFQPFTPAIADAMKFWRLWPD